MMKRPPAPPPVRPFLSLSPPPAPSPHASPLSPSVRSRQSGCTQYLDRCPRALRSRGEKNETTSPTLPHSSPLPLPGAADGLRHRLLRRLHRATLSDDAPRPPSAAAPPSPHRRRGAARPGAATACWPPWAPAAAAHPHPPCQVTTKRPAPRRKRRRLRRLTPRTAAKVRRAGPATRPRLPQRPPRRLPAAAAAAPGGAARSPPSARGASAAGAAPALPPPLAPAAAAAAAALRRDDVGGLPDRLWVWAGARGREAAVDQASRRQRLVRLGRGRSLERTAPNVHTAARLAQTSISMHAHPTHGQHMNEGAQPRQAPAARAQAQPPHRHGPQLTTRTPVGPAVSCITQQYQI